jgi:hypothetical protein
MIARLRHPEQLLALALGIFHLWLMGGLHRGDFFNSYPFISDDGFDWIAQGVALNERIVGVDASPWPVLRNPVFVLVTALDDALHASGDVIIFANAAAVTLTFASLGWLGRQLGHGAAALCAALLALCFSTLGFWRLWVLSDTICVALMTASFCLAISHVLSPKRFFICLAAVFAVAAGLTQTYGIIAFCGVVSTVIAGRALTGGRIGRALPATLIAVVVLTFGLQKLWAAAIPHSGQPAPLDLLKPSFAMTRYYLNVWATSFGVFAPLVIAALAMRLRRNLRPRLYEAALAATLLTFIVLSYFYQWRESRFTFIYLTIFFAALLMITRPPVGAVAEGSTVERKLIWTCAASALIGLLVVPSDYWMPRLMGTRVDWNHAWVGEALRAQPADRFDLAHHCPSIAALCAAAAAPPQSSPYRQQMFDQYKRRTANDDEGARRSPAPYRR